MNTISRDSSGKQVGIRLQKMRAAAMLLEYSESPIKHNTFVALEVESDVQLKTDLSNEEKAYFEENKNYALDSKFSFNSIEILKTLVIFFDIWCKYNFDSNVKFIFYSTNSISQENGTEFVKSNDINLPETSILEYLVSNKSLNEILDCLKKYLKGYYKLVYRENRRDKKSGNMTVLESLSDESFMDFFRCIDWKFGMPNEVELENSLVEIIKKSRHFDKVLEGFENEIKDSILSLLDGTLSKVSYFERYIHSTNIENIFLKLRTKLAGQTMKAEDPLFKMWEDLKEKGVSDKRNIVSKILAVCVDYSEKELGYKSRSVAKMMIQEESIGSDKSFLSQKYRIWDFADKYIMHYIKSKESKEFTEEEIETMLNNLKRECINLMQDSNKVYFYNFLNEDIIEGVILELIDSCYLSFDNV